MIISQKNHKQKSFEWKFHKNHSNQKELEKYIDQNYLNDDVTSKNDDHMQSGLDGRHDQRWHALRWGWRFKHLKSSINVT